MKVNVTIAPAALGRFGQFVLQLIEDNVAAGVDRKGNAFAPYSTRPFARPLGGVPKRAISYLKSSNAIQIFTTKRGSLWMVVEGGYAALKTAIRQSSSGVDMQLTGDMMKQLAVLSTSDNGIVIGFLTAEAAEKAYYATVAGAGKSRVIRDFLGLTDQQWDQAVQKTLTGEGAVQISITF